MPETTLLYTLNKKINSITFNENKAWIDNGTLAIVGYRSYYTVEVFGPAQGPGIWDLARGFEPEVLSEGSRSGVLLKGSGSRVLSEGLGH